MIIKADHKERWKRMEAAFSSGGIKISRVRHESLFEMKQEHYHSYFEFYYLLSGKRRFFLNNKVYHVNSGDLMAIPKGEIHRTTYYSEGVHERIVMNVTQEAVDRLLEDIGQEMFYRCFMQRKITIPVNRRAYLEELFEKLLVENHLWESGSGDELSEALCKRYCDEILLFIIRCQRYGIKDGTCPEGMEISFKEDIRKTEVERAALYMSDHFCENITLKKMADLCCMSESYFSKRFKQVTGFGFKEYLNEVRIRNACSLLLTTDKTITEIASACGFMDSNYFGDAFRKKKNVSPRQFRNAGGRRKRG